MTRTAGAPIGCQRPSRFWGLGCPKIYHEAEDTLAHGIPGGHPQREKAAQGVAADEQKHGYCRYADLCYLSSP
ncbi:hypothetical protein, partial [Thiolapillus sp.]|uniref:hypothetical protein n=1 Tax=Thiolapillus sp. TaxID=2017437 RepID=UPI003AF92663